MNGTVIADRPRSPTEVLASIDFEVISIWVLAFGLTVYLGLRGGGFDALVSDKVGIVVWWIVLAGLAVGAFPRNRLGIAGWSSLGLLAAFLAWTALSLIWTESSGSTNAEIARVSTYLGVFSLVLSVRGWRGVRLTVAALASGIAVLALIGLLSRMHPAWFPDATQTGNFLHAVRNRLSYPLEYWNGVAALTAMGLPLLINLATTGRSIFRRSLAAAPVPALVLTIYLTISRGGIVAGAVALVVYFAAADDRLERLLTGVVAGIGGVILIGAADQRNAFQEGLTNAAAHHQGTEMLWITIIVCLAVGLIQAAISTAQLKNLRPAWTVPNRGQAIVVGGIAAALLVVLFVGLHGPHRVSHAIDEFKSGKAATGGAARLSSAAGEQRYPLWQSAVREFDSEPLHGTGAGTFELWWDRNKRIPSVVHDTHSLYLQTLGELGVIGILLLGGFVVLILAAGTAAVLGAERGSRSTLAAALAGVVAFLVSAAIDWVWQIPVLPIAMLLLAGVLITAGAGRRSADRPRLRLAPRIALCVFAVAAIVGIAIPLSSATLIRESQARAREADLPGALEAARSAAAVEPDASLPYLQEALVLEQAGLDEEALAEARYATEREPTNWANWFILSRIQTENGQNKTAELSFQEAASLNPFSPIIERQERVEAAAG